MTVVPFNPLANMPPHDIDAERAVLGACMLDQAAAFEALEVLSPADFYPESHRDLFQAIADLIEMEDKAPDFVLLTDQLRRLGTLERAGGASYISNLIATLPDIANVRWYAEIVREKAKQRSVIAIGQRLALPIERSDPTIEAAVHDLLQIQSPQRSEKETFGTVAEHCVALSTGEAASSLFPLGLRGLDEVLILEPPQLVLLAALSSQGKTSLALQIAVNGARRGQRGLVFSYEMSTARLRKRILAAEMGVPMGRLQMGKLSSEERGRALEISAALDGLPLGFVAASGMSIRSITAMARSERLRRGLDWVVIDYLQLIAPTGGRQSREVQVNEIAMGCLHLAVSLNIPVFLLAQLNKDSIKEKRRPTLNDIRESSAPSQHADAVLAIHTTKDVYDEPYREVELLVLKQRDGSPGVVAAGFNKRRMRFE